MAHYTGKCRAHQLQKEEAHLLLVLQCMLSSLQAILQVGLLCSFGCLGRQQHLCLCLQLQENRPTKAVILTLHLDQLLKTDFTVNET